MTDEEGNQPMNLLEQAALELEALRPLNENLDTPLPVSENFPSACYALVKALPGNKTCVDCSRPNPDWASVSYGTLICLQCCGKHRSYGVNISKVRSLAMDSWSQSQILCLLEGGNQQYDTFLERHLLKDNIVRYRTQAARFYRENMFKHVTDIIDSHCRYKGRKLSRKLSSRSSSRRRNNSHNNDTTT